MSRFFSRKPPDHPAQIQLLSKGHLKYHNMFNVVDVSTTSERTKEKSSIQKLELKKVPSRDNFQSYYSDVDILTEDLEKKIRLVLF
mmetsp:Transcript_8005/g.17407  ORF Transcript_8005/g.17407 Transcript_8005/m.17407 type:complete len:86 (-) Transcript_8005:256-513(-)